MTDFEIYTMFLSIASMSLVAAFMCGKARYYRSKCKILESEKERISILLGEKNMVCETLYFESVNTSKELMSLKNKYSRSYQKRDERGRFVKQVEQE